MRLALLAPLLASHLLALDVSVASNSQRIPPWEVFELSFTHANAYADPFFDAQLEVTFTSPNGHATTIGGFFFGSADPPTIQVKEGRPKKVTYTYAKHDLWKARFAPTEPGGWRYAWTFTDAGGAARGEGAFSCVVGRTRQLGFLRISPTNPFRFVFDDGSPFYPIGLQDGAFDNEGTGSILSSYALEGPFRMDRQGRPAPPAGAMYQPGPSSNPVNGDVYFRRYARGGFNLFRFSQDNFSLDLYDDLEHWRVHEAVMVDELMRHARKYGFRVMYGIFGYQAVSNEHPDDAKAMARVKRFVKYTVDRWGAYVDLWEFLNEQKAADGWYAEMAPYLRSFDPYRHPITTSWERPDFAGIEVNAPHWYEDEDELKSDSVTAGRAREWKKAGKPVIVGEQGNQVDRAKAAPGVGGVWDARSALRMRVRCWTALFHEVAFVFWNTSYAKDGHNMNLWIGPKEREYVRAMQDFAYRLGPDPRMVEPVLSEKRGVRGYALASSEAVGVYLHHCATHDEPLRGLGVTVDVPRDGRAYWYSPEDASILGSEEAKSGRRTFHAPPFAVDLALLVTSHGAPDIDGDGTPNDADLDDDNDGVEDAKDAFPLEPEEWADADGDLIGDVLDADDDGDGKGDDANGNGTPDCEEMDLDGDGVARARTVPWDAFPWDPKEWRDRDGDGLGDNADPDDDGDGWSDADEAKAGTDPLDRLSFPAK